MLDYIHDGHALPLRGTGYIRYAIGGNAQGLFLRLTGREVPESDRPGTWGRGNPICLHELLGCLADVIRRRQREQVEGYFMLEDLDTSEIHGRVDGKKDNNVSGFVTAVLIDIGFVEVLDRAHGRYRLRQGRRQEPPPDEAGDEEAAA